MVSKKDKNSEINYPKLNHARIHMYNQVVIVCFNHFIEIKMLQICFI